MANTLNLFRDGTSLLAKSFGVGFIDWLDARACNHFWRSSVVTVPLDARMAK